MKENCKYRLPCGWCDRQNKQCETEFTVEPNMVTSIGNYDDTSISYAPKRCRDCETASAIVSSDNTYRCLITLRIHSADDLCDCNNVSTFGRNE